MTETAPRHRFFAESLAGDVVELSGAEAHHALNVLRLTSGEAVEVFDGAGRAATGALRTVRRRAVRVEIARRRAANRPAPAVELAFAVPKGKRLDWLLEKATELGAAALVPVVFERSVARPALSDRTRRRWRSTCIAAAKQCRADFLPHIASPRTLADYLAAARDGLAVLGDPDSHLALGGVLKNHERVEHIRALLGPEGGLTRTECRKTRLAGFLPVRLGVYTLRVETAAVAFLASIRACCER